MHPTFGFLKEKDMVVPGHDRQVIDEADPNNVTITYYLMGRLVGKRTIAVSGTTTTIDMVVY